MAIGDGTSRAEVSGTSAVTGDPDRDALLRRDFEAIIGRLAGVEKWTNLTAAQRRSVTQALGRARMGLARLVD